METKIKFIKTQKDSYTFPNTTVTHETDAVAIDELLEEFEMFLKGCGYVFDGKVGILDED